MPILASCPSCRFEGNLPDDDPGGLIACPKCKTEFEPTAAAPPAALPETPAVWVGAGAPPSVTPAPRRALDPARVKANPLPTGPDGKPIEITAANAGRYLDWLRAEVARFDGYVARQLAGLRQQRDALAAAESAAADALVGRGLQTSRDQAELDADRAALNAEREGLARRAEALDRGERALQRRMAEVEELEQMLRGELDEREAEVERQRRAVAEALTELRARAPLTTTTDDLLGDGHCG